MFNTQSHALGHTSSTVDAPKQFALICMYVCVRRSNSTKTASGIFSFTFWLLLDLLGRCFRCLFVVVRFVVLLLHRTHTHTHACQHMYAHFSEYSSLDTHIPYTLIYGAFFNFGKTTFLAGIFFGCLLPFFFDSLPSTFSGCI